MATATAPLHPTGSLLERTFVLNTAVQALGYASYAMVLPVLPLYLVLRGEGETSAGGAGDLYVVISVREHETFERDGNDVLCEVPVGFPQLALGAEIDVPTLEGAVKLKVPAGTEIGRAHV